MRAHAEADYPHECCGGLLGTFDGETKTVTDVIALDNHWDDIPGEGQNPALSNHAGRLQNARKKSDCRWRDVVGVLPFHPDHPPIPSDTDLKFAWPFFPYPILAVKKGTFDVIKSYELIGDLLIEERITI